MASSPVVADNSPSPSEHTLPQTTTTLQTEEKTQESTSVPESSAPVSEEAPNPKPTQQQPKQSVEDDGDDESDFDELDEVLDDFKPKTQADTPAPQPPTNATAPSAPEGFDESIFMSQLEKDMAKMMGQAAQQSGVSDAQGFESTVDQGADAFTKQLEESGIAPGDFIKQLLADVMAEEADEKGAGQSQGPSSSAGAAAAAAAAAAATTETGSEAGAGPESFNDAIHRTINRMKESGDKATAAASEDNADDLIAQLLKAMEAGGDGSGGDGGDLTKIFMGMMEQLSNKDMLYEPMKELDTKFAPWIKENKGKGKVSEPEMERYEKQAELVSQIVKKFEEPGYTDENAKCREYVWEKMQAMQAAGNPPDELVANPWMDDLKGGGVPECPQQ